jgi:hypothetical protein
MHISPTCSYAAHVYYPHQPGTLPFISLQGGGDDFGVFITASTNIDGRAVELHLVSGQSAGRDARAMVRVLLTMPGWSRGDAPERALLGM